MQFINRVYWKQWREKRLRMRFLRLVEKQGMILKDGICVYAMVTRVYGAHKSFAGLFLIPIQLSIQLPDDTKLHLSSSFLTENKNRRLEGKTVRIKLLPGDLSQIVLLN